MKRVDIEELRSCVEQISRKVEEIRSTGISEKALVLLIQHCAPGKISQKQITAVLNGMEALTDFVFPGDER